METVTQFEMCARAIRRAGLSAAVAAEIFEKAASALRDIAAAWREIATEREAALRMKYGAMRFFSPSWWEARRIARDLGSN